MNNDKSRNGDVESSSVLALENLTKTMLKAVNKAKNSSRDNSGVNDLRKTIKDIIENSELNDENN